MSLRKFPKKNNKINSKVTFRMQDTLSHYKRSWVKREDILKNVKLNHEEGLSCLNQVLPISGCGKVCSFHSLAHLKLFHCSKEPVKLKFGMQSPCELSVVYPCGYGCLCDLPLTAPTEKLAF